MLNRELLKIEKENTFSLVTKKIREYKENNPDKELISLGIGDVSLPIIPPVIDAMHKAVDDLSRMETFHGYGNYYGLESLRKLIWENEYRKFGFTWEEIYVGDGTKSDSSSILELFDKDAKILVGNPLYPIYRNGALSLSRNFIEGKLDKGFKMMIPKEKADLIYLCSPNNPVGVVYTKQDLRKWVRYALKNHAVILFDNVYEAFIQNKELPHSIYEIEGAERCAIEFRSFSKKASFTGMRCSYFVLPERIESGINFSWKERTLNRFNGASYVAQKGAEATYLPESKKLMRKNILTYLKTAHYLKENLTKLGFEVAGGEDAPFMWVKIKDDKTSWETFDFFLNELGVVIIPGIIFGSLGDGYFRVSALGKLEDAKKAVKRIKTYVEK